MASSAVATTETVDSASVRKHYKSYTFEDRFKVIRMWESGLKSLEIGRTLEIDSSLIRGWIRQYRKYGVDGLIPRSSKLKDRRPTAHLRSAVSTTSFNTDSNSNTDPASRNGFVHYVDNPALVRSMVCNLLSFGVLPENIIVGVDVLDFLPSFAAGNILVVNSLFDLSGDLSKLLHTLEELLRAGITVVSISDKGYEIKPDDSCSAELVSVIRNYISPEWKEFMNGNERVYGK